MSLSEVLGVLALLLFVVVPVMAAVLIAVLTRGRVRALGLAGFLGLATVELIGVVWTLVLPRVVNDLPLPLSAVAGAYGLVRGVLTLAAILLIALAVVVDRGRPQPVR